VAFLALAFTPQHSGVQLQLEKLLTLLWEGLPQVTPDYRRDRIVRIIARAKHGDSYPIQLGDRLLGLLESSAFVGWEAWTGFEREFDGLF
jgi:hypothetical protein